MDQPSKSTSMIPGLVITLIIIALLFLMILAYEEFSRLCIPTSGDPKTQVDGLPSYEEAVKSENS